MWPYPFIRVGEIELQPYGLILIAVVLLAVGLSCWETRVYPGFVNFGKSGKKISKHLQNFRTFPKVSPLIRVNLGDTLSCPLIIR